MKKEMLKTKDFDENDLRSYITSYITHSIIIWFLKRICQVRKSKNAKTVKNNEDKSLK